MLIQIDTNLRLELTSVKHAAPLYSAIEANRLHLSQFLPWVPGMQTEEDLLSYIKNCEALYQQKKEVSFVIFLRETPVGRIGLHHINPINKSASIGYWLVKNEEGQGIITRSCKALINYGFQVLKLHRVEIKAATANSKSQAIPERLHFRKEGILHQAEWVNNECLDLFLYVMLAGQWTEGVAAR